MTEKLKKMLAVILLTLVIWAWAYLAQEETTRQMGSLKVNPRTGLDVLVSFVDYGSEVPLMVTLKGPAAKVAELQKNLHAEEGDPERETLEFYFNPEIEGRRRTGTYEINILNLLKETTKIQDMGLTVVSCEPETVMVDVQQLVEKELTVQAVDENRSVLLHESIEPARVSMYVPAEWSGDMLKAYLELTPAQQQRARETSVMGKPYIRLYAGGEERKRFASIRVEVKLLSAEQRLLDKPLQPRIGFIFSSNLQGKYTAELLPESESDFRTINLQATEEAFNSYRNTPYQVLVEVRDGDANIDGDIPREVIYNFPQDYVRKNEIRITPQSPQRVIFRLRKVPPAN